MSLTLLIPIAIVLVSAALAYRSLRNKSMYSASRELDNDVLEIRVPKKVEDIKTSDELKTAPIASENMFASLHGLLKITPDDQEQFSFEIESSKEGIRFYTVVPKTIRSFIESQIYAQYPDATIKDIDDYVTRRDRGDKVFVGATFALSKPQFYPIKTFKDFEVDPISAITSALTEIKKDEELWFQILVRPVPDVWQQEGYDYIKKMREGLLQKASGSIIESFFKEIVELLMLTVKRIGTPAYADPSSPMNARPGPAINQAPKLSPGQELEIKAIENKLTKMGFETVIRLVSVAESRDMADMRLRSLIASMKQFSTANLNGFTTPNPNDSSESFIDAYQKRVFEDKSSFVLNVEELASVFHLPTSAVETPTIAWSSAKKGEPPLNLPQSGSTIIGVTNFRDKKIEFGIKDEDRLRHMYLIGKTGSGKSQLFRNMIIQDMRNGKGVGVMDPHGTLIDELLEMVPENRLDDVVIFDPSDEERPVALNMLEVLDPGQKNLMASGIVSAIKQHFAFSWGPRLEYLLNIAVLTLLEVEGTTLLGITRLLADDNYRKFILHYVKDPVIREFWDKEFKDMKGNQKLVTEAIAPIQNKIGRFLSSSTIRNILGRPKSTIRVDDIMNGKKIFFINLSKGKIGDDNANLLGSLLVSRMQFGAMQRAKIPEKERVPFYLFVDEFQNFASGSFESILSEARKYKLALHITHQYTSQVPEEILGAVFGNVGTMVALAIGAPDAEILGREFGPVFTPNDLISQERQHMYLKLMIDGMTSAPFSAYSLTRITGGVPDIGPRAIELSREKYGQDRAYIEEKIRAWVERKFDLGMAIAEENRRKKAVEDQAAAEISQNAQQAVSFDKPNDPNGEVLLERKE